MNVEICANSYQSAINAKIAGADRIELCSELAVGGITPSYGLIKKIKNDLRIPVHVLIRPRSGNFTYSKVEFEIMKMDIIMCKNLGCEGVVSGILNVNNTIDIIRTKELVELAKPMNFTFHRAFDWVKKPIKSLEELMEIGVSRVLSSGLENNAVKGIEVLKKMKIKGVGKIEIMPGGGVNKNNILEFQKAGFSEIHFSGTKLHKMKNQVNVPMLSKRFYDDAVLGISDVKKISIVVNMVNGLPNCVKK